MKIMFVGDRPYIEKYTVHNVFEVTPNGNIVIIDEQGKPAFLMNMEWVVAEPSINLRETASELNVEITFSPDGKVYVFGNDHIEHCYVAETEEDLVSILEGFEMMNKFKVKV